jgi:hypothetical protein
MAPHHARTTCVVADDMAHVPRVLASRSPKRWYTVPVSLLGETTAPKS